MRCDGYKVAGSVDARLAKFGIELTQTISNRHVRADDNTTSENTAVAAVVHLVENAPRRQHPHNSRFPAAGRHLAGVAGKARVAGFFAFVARLVARYSDSLREVRARFL